MRFHVFITFKDNDGREYTHKSSEPAATPEEALMLPMAEAKNLNPTHQFVRATITRVYDD